jgi:lysophospholipase L1-like esterase
MNTNPHARTIVCFGDSNTWGQKPDRSGRYASNERWTGRLQELLGDDYTVVEEGLSGRTVNLDYANKPGRNGRTYFAPCLQSHSPLDAVIIMLGTNDVKIEFDVSAESIAKALGELVDDVTLFGKNKDGVTPKIVLISPALVDDTAPRFYQFYTEHFDKQSAQKSQQLAFVIHEIAKQKNCAFIDAASVAKTGEDGVHLSEDSQEKLAELVSVTVKELFPEDL